MFIKMKIIEQAPLKLDQSPLSWLANRAYEPADEQISCALGTFGACAVGRNLSPSLIYASKDEEYQRLHCKL
jgi:hypothetical protein